MKKIILISALFLAIIANAQLQEEGFAATNLPAGWVSDNATSGCDWQYGYTGIMPGSGPTVEADFPTGAVLFDDASCGNLSEDRITLTAPTIDLSGVSNAEIEVVYNLQVFGDKGEFTIEVFDGSSWQQLYFQDVDTPRNTGVHQTMNLDVTPYLNSAFQVRFIYDDEGLTPALGLGIDNYKLFDSSVASIEDLELLGFSYYPNPANNVLQLNARENIVQINVYNILGQEVMFIKPDRTNTQLDLTKLEIGAYIIKVQVDDKLGSFRLLKQ
ncbi:MAG: T9SS type A sorting domain-containing protein [Thiohalomonadales bacterium]